MTAPAASPLSPDDPAFRGTVHATCVALDGLALLLAGPSGSGKSDLALRLIDRGAALVSDDYSRLARRGDVVVASAPERIAGRIEVRGLGLVDMPCLPEAPVALWLDMAVDTEDAPERYPLHEASVRLCGLPVPRLRLRPFEASAPLKAELALRRFGRPLRRMEAV